MAFGSLDQLYPLPFDWISYLVMDILEILLKTFGDFN